MGKNSGKKKLQRKVVPCPVESRDPGSTDPKSPGKHNSSGSSSGRGGSSTAGEITHKNLNLDIPYLRFRNSLMQQPMASRKGGFYCCQSWQPIKPWCLSCLRSLCAGTFQSLVVLLWANWKLLQLQNELHILMHSILWTPGWCQYAVDVNSSAAKSQFCSARCPRCCCTLGSNACAYREQYEWQSSSSTSHATCSCCCCFLSHILQLNLHLHLLVLCDGVRGHNASLFRFCPLQCICQPVSLKKCPENPCLFALPSSCCLAPTCGLSCHRPSCSQSCHCYRTTSSRSLGLLHWHTLSCSQ